MNVDRQGISDREIQYEDEILWEVNFDGGIGTRGFMDRSGYHKPRLGIQGGPHCTDHLGPGRRHLKVAKGKGPAAATRCEMTYSV